MTHLSDFLKNQYELLQQFDRYWRARHMQDRKQYPIKLDSLDEWAEQFEAWLDTQKDKI